MFAKRLMLAAAAACWLTGCLSRDPYLRTPQLMPRHPAAEREAAEFHDPFPDENMGPAISGRPPGFQQRTTTRNSAELRGLHLLGPEASLPAKSAQPGRRYSEVVSP